MIFKEKIGFIKDPKTGEIYVYLPFDVIHNPHLLEQYIKELRQKGMTDFDEEK